MATISNIINASASDSIVLNQVGICFFDPISESLIELSQLPGHFLTVEPYKKAIRKYYIAISTGSPLSYINVSLNADKRLSDLYTIKQIIADQEPDIATFGQLINLNTARIENPVLGSFIPLWVYIESKMSVSEVLSLEFEVDYE